MSVATSISYVTRPQAGFHLSAIQSGVSAATRRAAVVPDPRPVHVRDTRDCDTKPSLSRAGFELIKLKDLPRVSWTTPEQVREKYYPYLQGLIADHTGASRVEIVDQRLRSGSAGDKDYKLGAPRPKDADPPAGVCHVDYTTDSAPEKVRKLFPEEAERLLQKPFAIIQVWQPLKGPLVNSPLALMDSSSIQPPDLMPLEIQSPATQEHHYIYAVAHNEDHRWFYTHGMRTDEAYIFVGYDSRQDGRPRCVPHTAFQDPNTPKDAPPRHSIEFRTLAFWED